MGSGHGNRDDELIASLQAQIAELTKVISAQALALSALSARSEAPQPTIQISTLFSEYERVRRGEHSWVCIRNRLLPLVRLRGDRRVADLTPLLWAEHRAARSQEKTYRGSYPAAHTLNIELQRTKEMIDWGISAGLARENPLKGAKPVKTISARETWLSEPMIERLLTGVSAVPGERPQVLLRAFILCAVDAMLRFNEVRRLRRDRIANDGVIELSARETKSRKRRVVALTPRALAAIKDVPPVIGSPHVFTNPDTRKLFGEMTIRQWFRSACVASGVDAFAADGERVVPHSLRHSGASLADARGASAMTVKEALGHASLATTERYLHRHREAGARGLAKTMADGAEEELANAEKERRRGPHKAAPTDDSEKNNTGSA